MALAGSASAWSRWAQGHRHHFLSFFVVACLLASAQAVSSWTVSITAPSAGWTASAGGQVTVSWTQSGANTQDTVRVDLVSASNVVTALGTFNAKSGSTASGNTAVVTIPASQAGAAYSMRVQTLTSGTVSSSSTAGKVLPVLTFTTPVSGWEAAASGSLAVSWTTNLAAGDSSTPVQLYLVNSATSVVSAGLLPANTPALTSSSATVTVPAGTAAGTYRVRAVIGSGSATGTTNSGSGTVFSFTSSAPAASWVVAPGGSVTATWAIAPAVSTSDTVKCVITTTGGGAVATVLGTTPALSANGGGSFTFTVPSAQGVGSYSLALILLHGTTELSRTTTSGSVARTVSFTAPAAGWDVAPGGSLQVSWLSNVPASDATTALSLYLVSAASPTDVGTLLTSSAVVSAGGATVSVDASQVDGNYVLRAELDGQTVLSAAGTVTTPPSASSTPVSGTAASCAKYPRAPDWSLFL